MRWFLGKRGGEVGLYGKHPSASDFLRFRASSDALKPLDRWLSEALVAAPRVVESWDSTYRQAGVTGFVFNSGALGKGARCLTGVLAPSHDRSGRSYPLIVFAEVELELALLGYSALPLHPHLERSAALLARRAGLGREALLQSVEDLASPDEASIEASLRARDAALAMPDGTREIQSVLQACGGQRVQSAVDQLRQVARSTDDARAIGRFGIRCPLGNRGVHPAFWLRVLQRHLGLPLVPSALWTDDTMLIYLHRPAPKALAALWSEVRQGDDSVLDLAAASQASSVAPAGDIVAATSLIDLIG